MAAGGVAGADYLRGVLLMSDLRKAAQQALEALENAVEYLPIHSNDPFDDHFEAIKTLKAALAQPDPVEVRQGWEYMREKGLLQEPVAWINEHGHIDRGLDAILDPTGWTPLYAHPPQRKPLTEDELETAYRAIWRNLPDDFNYGAYGWIEQGIRYAEKAHGIGGEE